MRFSFLYLSQTILTIPLVQVDELVLSAQACWHGWTDCWWKCKKIQSRRHFMSHKLTSLVTVLPKSHPAPLGLTLQVAISSGSDHMRSIERWLRNDLPKKETASFYSPQKAPSCGTSCARAMIRIWSSVRTSGLSPPWTQSTRPSIIWRGKRVNVSSRQYHHLQVAHLYVQQQDLNSQRLDSSFSKH